MSKVHAEVTQQFGNRVRVRVCGICTKQEGILVVNHRGIRPGTDFWCPPGGGVQLGEPVMETLRRELGEETGLLTEPGALLFVNEFIGLPLHAIELFFQVRITGGALRTGSDPELSRQIIKEVRFLTFEELRQLPPSSVHSLFHQFTDMATLLASRSQFFPIPVA